MKVIKSIVFMSAILSIAKCNSKGSILKTTFETQSLVRAALDSGKSLTLLKIINVYPTPIECDKNNKYANLYVCKKFTNGDTVYVFEECRKVSAMALDTTFRYAAVIAKDNFILDWPNEFTVFIPIGFKISNNAKCFFADISYQTEY